MRTFKQSFTLKLIQILLTIWISVVIFPYFLNAQQPSCGFPANEDPTSSHQIIQKLKTKVGQDISQLPKRHKDKMAEAYKERTVKIVEELEQGVYYFTPVITDYFQSIFLEIVAANPILKEQDLQLLISRYPYPNAYCTGAGTIVFNLELLPWLENKSQIAFVICHEIAHHTLNHSNNALKENIYRLYSKRTQQELKKIEHKEIGAYTKATKLLKGLVFEQRRHSRLHEAEADSLALIYLKNTSFDATAAIRSLELLDGVDGQRIEQTLDLKEIFHSEAYPFKDYWLEEEQGIFGSQVTTTEEWDSDSLKTHPDCKKRIHLLQPQLETYQSPLPTPSTTDQELFKNFQFQANYELAQNTFHFQNLGKSLYHTLLLLEQYPEEACLHALVGKILIQFYEAQQYHKLENYLEPPAPWHSKQYKTLLEFLQNLRLKDIAHLNYQYLVSKKADFTKHPSFYLAFIQAEKLINDH